jgi:hypothetical protein
MPATPSTTRSGSPRWPVWSNVGGNRMGRVGMAAPARPGAPGSPNADSTTAPRPRLRLVGQDRAAATGPGRTAVVKPSITPAEHGAITDTADPRWVLAVRTAEALEGAILPPEKRERLIRLGRVMGLSPFDAALVIAIVQDQARRGYAPAYCPTAGESQLRMVPRPRARTIQLRHWAWAGAGLAACLAVELTLLGYLFLR